MPKIPTAIAMTVSKEKLNTGQNFLIPGTLYRSDTNKGIGPLPIKIYINTELLTERTTNDIGNFWAWVDAPSTDGYYTVKTVFPGTPEYEACQAEAEITVGKPPKKKIPLKLLAGLILAGGVLYLATRK